MKNNEEILIINSSEAGKVDFRLFSPDEEITKTIKIEMLDADFLTAIQEFLNKNRLKLSDLQAVGVVNDHGSFVTQRISLAVLNTLSWVNKFPLFPVEFDEFDELGYRDAWQLAAENSTGLVLPKYQSAAVITPSKKSKSFKVD